MIDSLLCYYMKNGQEEWKGFDILSWGLRLKGNLLVMKEMGWGKGDGKRLGEGDKSNGFKL